MGVARSKQKMIFSDKRNSSEDACKSLEAKLTSSGYKNSIVTLAPETVHAILSPRNRSNRIALASINGKEYKVSLEIIDNSIVAVVKI